MKRIDKTVRERAIEMLLIAAWSPERYYMVDVACLLFGRGGFRTQCHRLANQAFGFVDDRWDRIVPRQLSYAEAAQILEEGWTP